MSKLLENIKLQFLTEIADLEALFNGDSLYFNTNCTLKTEEVVIRYTVNNESKYMLLREHDICRIMKERAAELRREVAKLDIMLTE